MIRRAAALLGLALLAAAPASAAPSPLGAQFRYWAFDDHNDNRDWLAYWHPWPFHVVLETWDFIDGEDQFRPELGYHWRDRRRSTYQVWWRHEHGIERVTVATDQLLQGHFVGRGSLGTLFDGGSTDFVFGAGLDYYWGSWNFASLDVIRDPRGDGLWTFPMRVRMATERNDWAQLTLAPASERTFGWAADVKYRWLRLGVERNSRYDFTTRDNIVYTVGAEIAVPWAWR